MWKGTLDFAKWLWQVTGDPDAQRHLLFILTIGVCVHIAWVCGYIPGLSGVAWASDVASLEVQQHNTELTILKGQMDESLIKRCQLVNVPAGTDSSTLQQTLNYVNQNIREMSDRYFELTKRQYNFQSCDVLLILAR